MSRYGETILYRQVRCRWCGAELVHQAEGRSKKYCSAKCRVYNRRAEKRWARKCVDAILAHEPEPARDWGYPIEHGQYRVNTDGSVTKRV
jgi:hypothetical protein